MELEKQKEFEQKKGYFSNLAEAEPEPKEPAIKKEVLVEGVAEEKKVLKKKKKGHPFGFLLPLITIAGFVFLWYQLGFEPVQLKVNDALVFLGIREAFVSNPIDEIHAGLDTHHQLVATIVDFIQDEKGKLETISEKYQLHSEEMEALIEGLDSEFAEVKRLWGFKSGHLKAFMTQLEEGYELEASIEYFIHEQDEMNEMIREALERIESGANMVKKISMLHFGA